VERMNGMQKTTLRVVFCIPALQYQALLFLRITAQFGISAGSLPVSFVTHGFDAIVYNNQLLFENL
jgi:hypothetical protein